MFIDTKVSHKMFGAGIIKDLEMNSSDTLKSRVVVEFDSGKISKFTMSSFSSDGFFTTDDEAIIPFVDKLIEEKINKEKEELKAKLESKVFIPSYKYDEVEREVTKEDWLNAYKVAESYRFPNESRAVVMDSDLIFINASAAMKYMKARVKDCDKIYKACENRKKFLGSHWEYANRESIKHIIDLFDESEE